MNFCRDKIDQIITTNNGQWNQAVLDTIDCWLRKENLNQQYLPISNHPGIHYHGGDIFELPVEVLVNPINEYGLGCFQVGHNCLDNQIHRRCGPKLRQECREVLKGRVVKPGEVFYTKAYNLRAKYIFHALGPEFRFRDDQALLDCYVNSLNLMDQLGVKSIAFPEISCGVYGYPKSIARAITDNLTVDDKIVYLVRRD